MSNKTSNPINESVSGLGQSMGSTARDFSERAREVASSTADSTISFAKKYPVHTALGALGVGCIVGYFSRRPK